MSDENLETDWADVVVDLWALGDRLEKMREILDRMGESLKPWSEE